MFIVNKYINVENVCYTQYQNNLSKHFGCILIYFLEER